MSKSTAGDPRRCDFGDDFAAITKGSVYLVQDDRIAIINNNEILWTFPASDFEPAKEEPKKL